MATRASDRIHSYSRFMDFSGSLNLNSPCICSTTDYLSRDRASLIDSLQIRTSVHNHKLEAVIATDMLESPVDTDWLN